jgi:hypothetical protein
MILFAAENKKGGEEGRKRINNLISNKCLVYPQILKPQRKNCLWHSPKMDRLCKEIAEEGYSHEKLHVFIEEIFKDSGIQYSDLSAIAVSKGPVHIQVY